MSTWEQVKSDLSSSYCEIHETSKNQVSYRGMLLGVCDSCKLCRDEVIRKLLNKLEDLSDELDCYKSEDRYSNKKRKKGTDRHEDSFIEEDSYQEASDEDYEESDQEDEKSYNETWTVSFHTEKTSQIIPSFGYGDWGVVPENDQPVGFGSGWGEKPSFGSGWGEIPSFGGGTESQPAFGSGFGQSFGQVCE